MVTEAKSPNSNNYSEPCYTCDSMPLSGCDEFDFDGSVEILFFRHILA